MTATATTTDKAYSKHLGAYVAIPGSKCDYCTAHPVARTNGPDIYYCTRHAETAHQHHSEEK